MKHAKKATFVITVLFTIASLLAMASEGLAFPVAPTTLSYGASVTSPTPASQTITFKMPSGKKSLVPRPWTASGNAAWMSVSPASGTISNEQDQIIVQVNATGMTAGTYSGTVRITIASQVTGVPVTLNVAGGSPTSTGSTTPTSTVTPSILLNPTTLSFSGVQGGPAPLAKPITLSNPTGGTLTWTLTETAAWLGLNIMSGTTTTEIDSISASVSPSGLAAGTYTTAITVAASGASNNPQIIPVTFTLNAPPTTGTAALTWNPSTDANSTKYNVYMGTQPGVYGPPVSVGLVTNYMASNLTSGKTYYFSVTVVDSTGAESQHSNEVYKVIQ